MIKLLISKFVKNYDDTADKKVRESYSILGGVLGLICNAMLFSIKLFIGFLMKSIAIMSDAFNNLSDMGSSLVAIFGTKLSNKKPDKEHPFGHGRIEYISSMAVSVIIMMVGFELLKTSFEKIKYPEIVIINPVLIGILVLSVLIKVWMFSYNRYIGNKINSTVMKAAAQDSLNDVFATGAVIISTVVGKFLPMFPVDGIVGFIVSVIVIYTGFGIMKDTVDLLIGKAPDEEIVKKLEDTISSADGIIGMHDLVLHDYGPGRVMASVHAEVPDDADIVRVHETIDKVEQDILNDMNIVMVIHMDPISVNCARTNDFKKMASEIIKEYDSRFTLHDFRITDGENNINIIFDMVVPCDLDQREIDNAVKEVSDKIHDKNDKCRCVIKVDRDYISR